MSEVKSPHYYGLFNKREYVRRAPNRLDEPEYREWWQPIGKQVVGVLWIIIHIYPEIYLINKL